MRSASSATAVKVKEFSPRDMSMLMSVLGLSALFGNVREPH